LPVSKDWASWVKPWWEHEFAVTDVEINDEKITVHVTYRVKPQAAKIMLTVKRDDDG
jgi:hypothetical protein